MSIKSTKTSIKLRKKENAEIAAKKAKEQENVEMGSIHESTQNQLARDQDIVNREIANEHEPDDCDQNPSKPQGKFANLIFVWQYAISKTYLIRNR